MPNHYIGKYKKYLIILLFQIERMDERINKGISNGSRKGPKKEPWSHKHCHQIYK